ncbi:MAG: glycoside hydrolase family 2 TIM barrel-domain containing protein [Fodinibius sp.]|nr:glycoside hydrolase family 2 TIM barrel-domain containing protein [Fodinibius sp.]
MTVTNLLHISHWGVAATTPVATEERAKVAVQTQINNDHDTTQKGSPAQLYFANQDGEAVAEAQKSFFTVEGNAEAKIQDSVSVQHPDLWSVDSPSLYTLETIIERDGRRMDHKETTVGIRDITYKTNEGFFLNGEQIKMHGVNLHHDGGPVGAAVPIGVWERRLKKLKAMGVNAIRTAHNPMSPEFMDLCDRMGFLVMDEVFDEWTYGKREYTYHRYFEDWWEKDLKAFIKRDRNHPSVVMWSAGNEIGERMPKTGVGTLERLMGALHQMDPTRPVTTGNDHIGDTTAPTTERFMNALDIVGYNYADRWTNRRELVFTPDKLAHPEWRMVGTESPNIYWVRDNYSLGDSTVVQPNYNSNMIRVEELWKFVSNHLDYVIGDFMWTGIDYLGEAQWPTKHASSGSLDLLGFPKDSYYLYQSQWTEKPMLQPFSTLELGRARRRHHARAEVVLAYTNVDAVELYVNGKYYGEKRLQFPRKGTTCGWNCYEEEPVDVTTASLHASWDVEYQPGTIKAVGKRDGEVVVTKEISTTGPPAALQLSVDQQALSANRRDVAHLRVEVVDDNGNVVPRANPELTFDVEGAGKLIGLGNGNPRDHTSHKANSRRAFNGLALAIIQATATPGPIRVTVQADGIPGADHHAADKE